MSEAIIASDLARKIGDQVDDVFRREMRLASAVLPSSGVAALYLEVVSRLGCAAIPTAASLHKPEFDPDQVREEVSKHLFEMIASQKAISLVALARFEKAA